MILSESQTTTQIQAIYTPLVEFVTFSFRNMSDHVEYVSLGKSRVLRISRVHTDGLDQYGLC